MHLRPGFSLLELLVAAAMMAAALVPIVWMASHNLDALRVDRQRTFAEALCHDTLERLGSSQAHPLRVLSGSGNLLAATDPWIAHPELFRSMGYEKLSERRELHMSLALIRDVGPELDMLACEVSWKAESGRRGEKVRYARFLTYDHTPQVH